MESLQLVENLSEGRIVVGSRQSEVAGLQEKLATRRAALAKL